MKILVRLHIFTFCFLLSYPTYASFNKNLWPRWEINNPLSTDIINHEAWQLFLDKYVRLNNEHITLVDYAHITEEDKKLLRQYIQNLTQIPIHQYNRTEQLAYWINLYNALVVRFISDYYPIHSIVEINISPGLFSIGPWSAKIVRVNNIPLSLDDIQHRIIRPIWNDARCNYALNNGSIGAPNLSRQAFRGSSLEQQLNEAATNYINSPRGVQVIEKQLVASKMYEWLDKDFGYDKKSVIAHMQLFANSTLKKQLEHVRVNTIHYVYNWHLNVASLYAP